MKYAKKYRRVIHLNIDNQYFTTSTKPTSYPKNSGTHESIFNELIMKLIK